MTVHQRHFGLAPSNRIAREATSPTNGWAADRQSSRASPRGRRAANPSINADGFRADCTVGAVLSPRGFVSPPGLSLPQISILRAAPRSERLFPASVPFFAQRPTRRPRRPASCPSLHFSPVCVFEQRRHDARRLQRARAADRPRLPARAHSVCPPVTARGRREAGGAAGVRPAGAEAKI